MDGTKLHLTDDEKFAALFGLLVEIRDAIVPTPEVDADGCQHPEEARVSLATPRFPDHWICNQCKFEHHGEGHS